MAERGKLIFIHVILIKNGKHLIVECVAGRRKLNFCLQICLPQQEGGDEYRVFWVFAEGFLVTSYEWCKRNRWRNAKRKIPIRVRDTFTRMFYNILAKNDI